jgi:hypothetical protein
MTTTCDRWLDNYDPTVELPEELDPVADAIEAALKTKGDLTASAAARAARTDTLTARRVLFYLVSHAYAHTSGNGAWTHYHPGRSF